MSTAHNPRRSDKVINIVCTYMKLMITSHHNRRRRHSHLLKHAKDLVERRARARPFRFNKFKHGDTLYLVNTVIIPSSNVWQPPTTPPNHVSTHIIFCTPYNPRRPDAIRKFAHTYIRLINKSHHNHRRRHRIIINMLKHRIEQIHAHARWDSKLSNTVPPQTWSDNTIDYY